MKVTLRIFIGIIISGFLFAVIGSYSINKYDQNNYFKEFYKRNYQIQDPDLKKTYDEYILDRKSGTKEEALRVSHDVEVYNNKIKAGLKPDSICTEINSLIKDQSDWKDQDIDKWKEKIKSYKCEN